MENWVNMMIYEGSGRVGRSLYSFFPLVSSMEVPRLVFPKEGVCSSASPFCYCGLQKSLTQATSRVAGLGLT